MTCTANGVAEVGQYANVGSVVGTPSGGDDVTDSDPSHYFGEEPVEFAGCTPGFWKNHTDVWEGYDPGDLFDGVFGTDVGSLGKGKKAADNPTLLDALNANGGGVNALARHAVAALLNAAHSLIEYPMSEGEIITAVEAALDGGDVEGLKNELDAQNNLGCSIDAHGNPVEND